MLETALQAMVDTCIALGEVPADFTCADVMLMTVHIRPSLPIDGDRATEIHTRYLDFMLAGLRAQLTSSRTPPTWGEWLRMWQGSWPAETVAPRR